MKKLNTIQKREKLNDVYATDDLGPGGANHQYMITEHDAGYFDEEEQVIRIEEPDKILTTIQLQKGPRNEEHSTHGIIDTDLLEIVRDRLKAFQAGPFSSDENAAALNHIEEALMWLNRRVEDRIERNTLGKNIK